MAKKGAGAQKGNTSGDRIVAQNRRAFYDYFIDESVETGIELTGSEIKSIRDGNVTIGEAYVRVDNHELWLIGANISQYKHGAYANHEPARPRKLLAHRREITNMAEATERKGMTLVPLRLKLVRGKAKLDVGIARGKKLYDKRQAQAERDAKRDVQQAMRTRD